MHPSRAQRWAEGYALPAAMLARLRSPSDATAAARGTRERRAARADRQFQPTLDRAPDLPAIDWGLIDRDAPKLMDTSGDIPPAEALVITWADAEWAALEHVFCSSTRAMSYAARTSGSWGGWRRYAQDLPGIDGWDSWGQFRLVQINAVPVLLFKSNTHLDYPGEKYLEQLLRQLLAAVKPSLVLSTGTAGGTRPADDIGTVNVTNAGTLYEAGQAPSQWPTYSNRWQPDWTLAGSADFARLLLQVPATPADLQALCVQFNAFYRQSCTLAQLDVGGLDMPGKASPINNLAGAGTPLLTTDSFVVGNQTGNLAEFACVEMDDAIVAKVCSQAGVSFGSVRNISDPVQNATLAPAVQAHWAQAIYDVYGLYTSFNSALTAWAVLAA